MPDQPKKPTVGERIDQLRGILHEAKIGPTGEFPQGQINDADEGELRIAIGAEDGNVVIHFGKQVSWIAMPPQKAADLAATLLARARQVARESGETISFTVR